MAPPSSFEAAAWHQNTEINSGVPPSNLKHTLAEMGDPERFVQLQPQLSGKAAGVSGQPLISLLLFGVLFALDMFRFVDHNVTNASHRPNQSDSS